MSRYPVLLRSAGMAVFALLAFWLLPISGAVFTSQLVTNLPAVTGLPFDSTPTGGAYLGGYLYFAATDGPEGTNGMELWRTDGTTAGTTLVKDINPGAGDSSPSYFVVAETNIFFMANDGVHGLCLWKSDGTAAGTTLAFNPQIPPGGSPLVSLYACGNGALLTVTYIYGGFPFSSSSTTWRSDGTPNGTFTLTGPGGVVTTNPVSTMVIRGSDIALVTTATGTLFDNSVTNTLWHFGGNGPYFAYGVFTSTNPINGPAIVGTNCCFITPTNYVVKTSSTTNTYYFEQLFRTSFVSAGTPVVVDATPAAQYSSSFTISGIYNDRVYYSYSSQNYSYDPTTFGPWKSIGQNGSPVNIEPAGSGSQYIEGFVNPYVYYESTNKLKRTDGLSTGVTSVDFTALGLQPGNFQQAASKFYFTTDNPQGLGITDLTPGGTHIITNAFPSTNAYLNNFVGNVGTTLIYGVLNSPVGLEPYRTDGTGPGTYLLKDMAQGHAVDAPLEAATIGGLELFSMNSPGSGVELWRSDGTAAGTFLLKDIRAGTNSSTPAHLTALNGVIYFSADDGVSGPELWRSDGTVAGTYLLKDIRVGAAGSNPSQFVTAGSLLFFVANDGSHGAELWQSDGTAAGTVMSQDITPGVGDGNIRALGAVGTNVYFFAGSSNTAGQFWLSDGQPGGTQFIKDLGSLAASQLPANYIPFNGKVYFPVFVGSPFAPYYIYVTDNTPAGTAPSILGGPSIATAGGNLFYTGTNIIYQYDGVSSPVVLTNFGSLGPPGNFQTFGSLLYFTLGSDLWRTDGTTNGTIPVAQFSAPQPNTPAPAQLTQYQNALLFTGWAPTLGRELWTTSPGQGLSLIEDLYPQSGDPQDLLVRAATNQVFYFARVPGQDAWQLRSLHLQSASDPPPVPYGGTAWPVPGLIEAENFDVGSDGTAYYDLTADNEGGTYRPKDGVDIQPCNDTGGGYCVYQTRAGEWLDYTIQVATSGNYQLDVRMTSTAADYGYFHFEVDGAGYYEFASLNNGTPGSWITESGNILLPAGRHTLRLVCEENTSAGDVGVFNWLNFTLLQTNDPPVVSITFPPAGGIISTNETKGLVASASDSTTYGQLPVEFFVDGQSVGISSNSTPQVAWTPTPGSHTVYARATDSFGVSANSSNVVFFVAEPVLASPSFWRVNAFGTNVPTAWRQTVYDDSKWPRLRSPLGFGYPGVTLMPSNFNGSPIPTFYFRQAISNDLSTFNTASITLTRDDGAIVYINGQSLARVNLPQPPTNVLFTTLASTNVFSATAAEDVIPVPLGMLVNGTNEIAVEIHQAPVIRDFDLKFDLTFSTFNYTPSPQLTVQVLGGRNLSIQWPDTSTGWTPQQSQDLVHWTDLTNSITDTNGSFYLYLGTTNFTHDFFRLRH